MTHAPPRLEPHTPPGVATTAATATPAPVLALLRVRLTLAAVEPFAPPRFLGPALAAYLDGALLRRLCDTGAGLAGCPSCARLAACPLPPLVHPEALRASAATLPHGPFWPARLLVLPPHPMPEALARGATFAVELRLVGADPPLLALVSAFAGLAERGLFERAAPVVRRAHGTGRLRLTGADALDAAGGGSPLTWPADPPNRHAQAALPWLAPWGTAELPDFATLAAAPRHTVHVSALTPLHLKLGGPAARSLGLSDIAAAAARRLYQLACRYGTPPSAGPALEAHVRNATAAHVQAETRHWRVASAHIPARLSRSGTAAEPRETELRGLVGTVSGQLPVPLIPWLRAGEWLGVGNKTAKGFGRLEVRVDDV